MKNLIRNKNFYFILLTDAVLISIAYTSAYLLRFEGTIPLEEWNIIKKTLPLILPLKLSVFFFFNLYKGMWRYTSIVDLVNVFKAVFVSTALIILVIVYIYNLQGFPRSVFAIDWAVTLLLIGGMRVLIRLILTNNVSTFFSIRNMNDFKRLIIVGAGSAAEKVLREITDNPGLKYNVIGFLDDDNDKLGKAIHGIPVLGTVSQISRFKSDFDEILIAIPSAKGDQVRRIVSLCEKMGKRLRTMPSLGELIGGKISIKAVREVTLEDLLGRDEIFLDQEKIEDYLRNKRVLITGAGGSIGGELVRQVSRFYPEALALVDFGEYNLFQIEMEIRQRAGYLSVHGYLADIKDAKSIESVFDIFKPDVIFHAAAYKHVPMQELHPWEAVKNNILGTKNLIKAAVKFKVKRFVLVSTDKAVRPSNVMGATKRIAEMLVQSNNENSGCHFMSVRFGNVVGSSGSVIPIFQDQILRGGPVTVTHPDMTRYFMSIPEAAQLILQAGSMGAGGEIFILDMGKPVRILDMAHDLIRLHGLEPEKDIPIQFIGLRPGEKLYEELITKGEGIVETTHEKIVVLRANNNYDPDMLEKKIDELIAIAESRDAKEVKEKLKDIVNEYKPQLTI